jgi:hypothetical protein
MHEYVRPAITEQTFWDDDGRVIAYGSRPVVDAEDGRHQRVNVYTNQDRYLPIFTVADALIEHIRAEYDVSIDEPDSFSEPARSGTRVVGDDCSRIVRIEPAGSDQAPLTITFGLAPGDLDVAAGFFSHFDMWFCGCDYCDDRWQDVADHLEEVVLRVVRDGLTEVIDRRRRGRARFWLDRRRLREWSGSMPKTWSRSSDPAHWSNILASLPQGRWAAYTQQ